MSGMRVGFHRQHVHIFLDMGSLLTSAKIPKTPFLLTMALSLRGGTNPGARPGALVDSPELGPFNELSRNLDFKHSSRASVFPRSQLYMFALALRFQTTVKSSKTVQNIVRYGPFSKVPKTNPKSPTLIQKSKFRHNV